MEIVSINLRAYDTFGYVQIKTASSLSSLKLPRFTHFDANSSPPEVQTGNPPREGATAAEASCSVNGLLVRRTIRVCPRLPFEFQSFPEATPFARLNFGSITRTIYIYIGQ